MQQRVIREQNKLKQLIWNSFLCYKTCLTYHNQRPNEPSESFQSSKKTRKQVGCRLSNIFLRAPRSWVKNFSSNVTLEYKCMLKIAQPCRTNGCDDTSKAIFYGSLFSILHVSIPYNTREHDISHPYIRSRATQTVKSGTYLCIVFQVFKVIQSSPRTSLLRGATRVKFGARM